MDSLSDNTGARSLINLLLELYRFDNSVGGNSCNRIVHPCSKLFLRVAESSDVQKRSSEGTEGQRANALAQTTTALAHVD